MTDHNHWQLIRAADYCCPAPPTVTRLQHGWRWTLRILGLRGKDRVEVGDNTALPGYREFEREGAVNVLRESVADWLEETDNGVSFLLDPPFSGTAAIARDCAWKQGWMILTPPDIDLIREVQVDKWWQQQQLYSGPWLIDNLARYLLRSTEGLRFIRALLPRLLQGEFGRGLVVCDSWAFAFLQRAWPLEPPRVYCFAPAGQALLRQLGLKGSDRQLGRLAARARGNVGVALALWACHLDQNRQLPELPVDEEESVAFVLFALLLHRGLNGEALQQVLPIMAPDQLNIQLFRLAKLGIVERNKEYWRLSVHGYLAVRDFLGSRDYLLDGF
ncbi:hypothetical protein [uncultured Oceanisphaera sp.]|uniref:hypothetical protein n=1 Tax=uncultured Oceanisphaera sp. TaxID=353858 RepID=UPI00261E1319|nr:hypothetical protein [uncultured Oceanisphaera sp.]